MISYISNSVNESINIAENFAKCLKPNDIIVLNGEMGAGKTHFTKGIARGLNIMDMVNSPTFTLLNVYDSGRLKLFHFDLYRINNEDEIYNLGLDDNLNMDGVCVIEWNKFNLNNTKHIIIDIEILEDERRKITINEHINN